MKRIAALGIALMVAVGTEPTFADTIGVSRCNGPHHGGAMPGLMTVEPDGTRTFHPVGQNGLTAAIVFNQARAFEWVHEGGMFGRRARLRDYDHFICGILNEDEEEAPEEQAPSQDTPEQEEPLQEIDTVPQ